MSTIQPRRRRAAIIAASLVAGLALAPVGAEAARMITGKQVKDNTITSADLKDKTIQEKDLSPAVVKKFKGETVVKEVEVPVVRDAELVQTGKQVNGYELDTTHYPRTIFRLDSTNGQNASTWDTAVEITFRPSLQNSSSEESKPVTIDCFAGVANGNQDIDTSGTPAYTVTLDAPKGSNNFVPKTFTYEQPVAFQGASQDFQVSCALRSEVDLVNVLVQTVEVAMLKVEG